jgi:hypothetical protein
VLAPILPWTPPDRQIITRNDFLTDVLDYKDSSLQEIPLWVAAYFNGESVESLPQYRGRYIFIDKQTGNDLNILGQFSIEKDFPLLIASRVKETLTRNISTYPDAVYGTFFEEAVKAFYDAKFDGVFKEDAFWIKHRVTREDGSQSEMFDFLTMVSADRRLLAFQINALISDINPSEKPTREQAGAVIHAKNNFINDF